jgi:hypothetical protein
MTSKKFNTQLFDFAVGFKPVHKGPYHGQTGTYVVKTAVAMLCPGWAVFRILGKMPGHKIAAPLLAFFAEVCFLLWFIAHIVEVGHRDSHALAWTAFFFMCGICGYCRYVCRSQYNIWGSLVEDYWIGFAMYPFALAQCEMAADNGNEGGVEYFHDLNTAMGDLPTISSTASKGQMSAA